MIVYLAGENWDGVAGTDRGMVEALSAYDRVLWVDPALSVLRRDRYGTGALTTLSEVADDVLRLRVVGPPGVTRPIARSVARALQGFAVGRALAAENVVRPTVVTATPMGTVATVPCRSVFYVTDDWVTGAPMMGLSRTAVRRRMIDAILTADVVAAVSPGLAEVVSAMTDPTRPVHLVPNGCRTSEFDLAPDDISTAGLVALAGQLNERLDFAVLDAVADRDVTVLVIGPRTEREPAVSAALDRFLSRSNVEWIGAVDSSDVSRRLRRARVGIVPYVESDFNRASFPLKTFDYLGAGLPVVTTDLPASHWMQTDHVHIATRPSHFADMVETLARTHHSRASRVARIDVARRHSWDDRARRMLDLVNTAQTS